MSILTQAQIFVKQLLEEKLSKDLVYHNYSHTEKVVKAVEEIGEHSEISKEDLEIALIAAWFHTSGYTVDYEKYLEQSQKIAEGFLKAGAVEPEKIEKVLSSIAATKRGESPSNQVEELVHDAILYPISQGDYLEISQNLRKEWEHTYQKVHTTLEWFQSRMKFVIESNFFTKYGKEVLEPGKDKVLKSLKKKMKKHQTLLDLSMEKELAFHLQS